MKSYKVSEIAEMMKLTEGTVTDYIRLGKLGAYKVGREYRITEDDFKKYINDNRNVKEVI